MAANSGTSAYDQLSVAQLKLKLAERNIDTTNCIEKSELIALYRETCVPQEKMLATNVTPGLHFPIEQNTPQWFHIRRGEYGVRIGGSEVGVVVGLSGYVLPYSLYEKIIGQLDETWVNDQDEGLKEACDHGHACEPLIAGMYAHYMKRDLREGGYYQHPDPELGELYGASPDRRVLDSNGAVAGLLEIKAPYHRMYKHVKPEHMAQMQYQMFTSGLKWCDYVAVKLDHDAPEKTIPSKIQVFLARVHRSDEFIEWMLKRLFFFSRCLILRQCPPRNLYADATNGLEPYPKPLIEVTNVETGGWTVHGTA